MRRIEATITGRVQGVSFRWYTTERAASLGLVGWVRNQADGSVRLEAEGDDLAVNELVEWLHEGPPHAVVTSVDVRDRPLVGGTTFEVRPST